MIDETVDEIEEMQTHSSSTVAIKAAEALRELLERDYATVEEYLRSLERNSSALRRANTSHASLFTTQREIVARVTDADPADVDAAVEAATRDGYTTTMFGRRRYLPDLRSGDRNRRQMAERMALNAPIQGTAADVIKLAMIELANALDRSALGAQLLLQVHDEVILEVTEREVEATRSLVEEVLSSVVALAVPLEVDSATGVTWFDAQKH